MTPTYCRPGVLAAALAGAWLALAFPSAEAAVHLPGDTFRDCETCGEMVVVPAGDFVMGSTLKASQGPPHKVTMSKDFAIGRREVTFAEWDRCVAASGCAYSPSDQGWGRDNHPAINLSWSDAKEYVAWLSKLTGQNYRLPSEAEWEYAARGGASTLYWWGKEVGVGHAHCADCDEKSSGTAPVGTFRPNGFGLYDTAGNASEWVEDCWNATYAGAPANGAALASGDCALRVLRGGSFLDKAPGVTSAARFRYDYDVRYYANGFRVARDLN